MIPIREQLMDICRGEGKTIKNNDNRIPRLLEELNDIVNNNDNSGGVDFNPMPDAEIINPVNPVI